MNRVTFLAALLTGSLVVSVAQAAGWADYEDAFPMFPCNDGWMACLVDGQAHSPDLHSDSEGLPTPASWRLSWFDLSPTSTFSPFGGLSEYTGEVPPGMEAEAQDLAEVPAPVVPDRKAEQAARRAEEERKAAEEAQKQAAEQAQAAAVAAEEAQAEARRQ
jgi:hypothetical protein